MDIPGLVEMLIALGFSRSEAVTVWRPLAIYVVGLVVYSIFIFEFYRFVARRDIIELELRKYASGFKGFFNNFFRTLLYILQYILIYPVLSLLWFGFFTMFLAVMAPGYAVDRIVLVSMSVVTAIRVTAYYSESLSQDLAKMLPLALLGVFLVEGRVGVSVPDVFSKVVSVATDWRTLSYYLFLLIAVEIVLRLITWIVRGTPDTTIDDEKDESEGE